MKKVIRYSLIAIGILILLLAIAPFLFKDKIQAIVQKEIDQTLTAEVYYGDIGLSFFRAFPNASVSIEDFGVVGKDKFQGDTLIAGRRFGLALDIWSVISGDEIKLKKVTLEDATLNALVLEDGSANWDIMVSDSTVVEPQADTTATEEGNMVIALESYELKNVNLVYDDAPYLTYVEAKGLNHRGKGNFTSDTYELDTYTESASFTTIYDGIAYLNKAKVEADFIAFITDRDTLGVALRENRLTVNDFTLGFDGQVDMVGDDIIMDLTYESQRSEFAQFMSLIPAVYAAELDGMKVDGSLVFNGFVKGLYNEATMPGFGLDLQVGNGKLQYPDLPESLRDIVLDLRINNPQGGPEMEEMEIDLRDFRASLAGDPLSARAKIKGLERMDITGNAKADLDLAKVMAMFPMEGTELRGQFRLDATAEGTYDEAAGTFPIVDAVMDLSNGYVKYDEYPAELTEFTFHGELKDADGALETAKLSIPQFHFLLDGEPLDGSLEVQDFNDPLYVLRADGQLDLAKLLQVYPIDSMEMSGKLFVQDFETKGRYSDVEAERYDQLPTRGTITVENVTYQDYVNPYTKVSTGTATFDPNRLTLSGVKGEVAGSDFAIDGTLTDYLGYALLEGHTLGGNLDFRSNRFDLNPFMVEEGTSTSSGSASEPVAATEPPTEEVPMEAFPVPDDLDITLNADIGQVIYDNLSLDQLTGKIRIVDEEVDMEQLNFNMLGGQVAMSGLYNTRNLSEPQFNFFLNLNEVLVQNAFTSFVTLQAIAPALEKVKGRVNAELGLSGLLGPEMMPRLDILEGLGKFLMLDGGMDATPMLAAIQEKTKLRNLTPIDLKQIQGSFQIEDGFLIVSPIDFNIRNTTLTLSGRQSLAGALDYQVGIDAPSTAVDQAVVGTLANLTRTQLNASERVTLNLNVGGTYRQPTVSGAGGGSADQLKDQLTEEAEDKLQDQLGVEVELDADSLKSQANEAIAQAKDSTAALIDSTKKQVQDSIARATARAREEAERKLREEAENKLQEMRNRFGLPGKKKDDGNN